MCHYNLFDIFSFSHTIFVLLKLYDNPRQLVIKMITFNVKLHIDDLTIFCGKDKRLFVVYKKQLKILVT